MNTIRFFYFFALLSLFCGCPSVNNVRPLNLQSEKDVIAIVVHSSNPTTTLSIEDLKTIYLGKKRNWSDGKDLHRIHFPPKTSERESFSKIVLGKGSFAMQEYWIQAKERGLPVTRPSETEKSENLLIYLQNNPQALGYVRLSAYEAFKKKYFRNKSGKESKGRKRQFQLKLIHLDGSKPSLEAARSGKYPLVILSK